MQIYLCYTIQDRGCSTVQGQGYISSTLQAKRRDGLMMTALDQELEIWV